MQTTYLMFPFPRHGKQGQFYDLQTGRLPRCGPHDTLIIHGKSIPLTEVLLDRDMSVHGKLKEPMFDVSTLPWRGLILAMLGSQHYYYPDPLDMCSRNRESSPSERHQLPRDESLDLQSRDSWTCPGKWTLNSIIRYLLPLEMWVRKIECLVFNKTVIYNGSSGI